MSILDFWRKSELMRILLIGRGNKGYCFRRVKIKSADGGKVLFLEIIGRKFLFK